MSDQPNVRSGRSASCRAAWLAPVPACSPWACDIATNNGRPACLAATGFRAAAGRVGAMPTPEFVTDLRAHIGHDMLWLSTAAGVVLDDDGQVLLGRRADTGAWAPPGGITEPGEEPADAAVREIFEETGVIAVPEALAAVIGCDQVTYQNGDVVRYLELLFRCRARGGSARVNDSESIEGGWYALADLPDLSAGSLSRIKQAMNGAAGTSYAFSGVEEVLGIAANPGSGSGAGSG